MISTFLASAPVGVRELRCVEINHSSFAQPLRLVHDYEDANVTLETGTKVTFSACAFRTARPAVDDAGRVTRSFQIDGVSGVLVKALLPASQSETPVTATFRVYLSDDLSAPQYAVPEVLSLTNIQISKKQITAQAENEDVVNRRFPTAIYTTANSPGLRR